MERIDKLENFRKKLLNIYGDETGSKVLDEIENKLLVSFRINTLKSNAKEVLNELGNLGFQISEGETPNSFYVNTSPPNLALSRMSLFEEGKIYLQNSASMLPALVLDPKPGDFVLDLCAAPGSKTSQIAALTANKANITAVENNINRLNSLKTNCQILGVANITFLRASSQNLLSFYPNFVNYFDKVLCDVPCSNEGLIRNPDTYDFKYWNPKTGERLSTLQKKVLASGIKMLKPGGVLVYSTCTFSVEENEQVVDWALRKFPEMVVIEPDLRQIPSVNGLVSWKNKTLNEEVKKTRRILPTDHFEAFFIAKMKKAV